MTLTKSKASAPWTCCGFRRRTVTSKLMTVVLQVIVVVVVWHLVKRNDAKCEECVDRKPERDSGEPIPICKPDEYSKGTDIQLRDLIIATDSDHKEGRRVRDILKVDIFVRDAESGTLVMYPKGTPFIKESDSSVANEDDGDSMSDFYYDNSVEEEDLDKITDVIDRNNISSNHKQSDGKYGTLDQNDNKVAVNADGTNIDNQRPIIVNGETGVLGNSESRMEEKDQMMIDSQQLKQNQLSLSANKRDVSINKDDVHSYPPGSQILSVQGNNTMQEQVDQINPNQQQNIDIQGQNIGVPNIPGKSDSESKVVTTSHIESQYDYDEQEGNDADSDNGQTSLHYTEGFQERIKMFKSEFYGQSLESQTYLSDAQYLINNSTICGNSDSVDLLFLIHSLPQSDEQRQRIRTTFVQRDLFKPSTVVHVFLVGKTNSPNFQSNLNADTERYGDIVQGDFVDKVETKTQKGLMGLKWTESFCPQAKNVLKIDEDVFVDTDKLLTGLIPTMNQVIGKRAMLCSFSQDAPIPRSGPNAVSPSLFPNSSKLRPYCKGFAVLMTPATVSSLLAASQHVPLCPVDDMFLYGVLPFIAGGIEVFDLGNKRAFHDFGMAVVTCYQELQDRCQYVITKAFSSRFTKLWDLMKARLESNDERKFMGQSLWDVASWRKQF